MKGHSVLLIGLICLLTFAQTTRAQLSGIQYILTPQTSALRFHSNSGLANDALYGGSVGFGFGRFIELHGLYLFNPRLTTDFTRMEGFEAGTRELLDLLPRKTTSMAVMGGELRLNLTYGALFPFMTIGSGAIRWRPENAPESWTIYASGSLGLQYTLANRYALHIRVEDLAYRANAASLLLTSEELTAAGFTPEDFRTHTLNNMSVRVGLQVYMGGRAPNQLSEVDQALQAQLRGGLRSLNLLLEPAYMQFRPHATLGMKRTHYLYSLGAGLDLGPYAGIQGFFWRDQSWKELQGYGGEFRLRFRSYGQATYPFISLGGGYLDVLPDYPVDEGVRAPEDQTFLLGGVGIHMALSPRITLTGMVRTLITAATEVNQVSSPADIQASWVYSGGLTMRLGSTPPSVRVSPSSTPLAATSKGSSSETVRREAEILALRRQVDSLSQQLAGIHRAPTAQTTRAGKQQLVTFPVPERGEIYIRYGPPGGVTVETLNGEAAPIVIDATTGRVLTPTQTPAAPSTQATLPIDTTGLRLLIRRIVQEEMARQPLTTAIQALERRLERLEQQLKGPLAAKPVEVHVQATAEPGRQFSGILPFTGISTGFGTHWVLGIRAEFLNTLRPSLRFSPELIYGFGGGPNLLNLNGNGMFMPNLRIAGKFQPYVGAGLGFLDSRNFELVFNMLLGVQGELPYGTFFAEWMDQDFFSGDRLIVGYRINL